MQIKTTVSYHFIPVRVATIKKIRDNKCKQGHDEKGNPVHCWWENIATVGTVWSFLNKLKIELPYDPVIPSLGIHPKEKQHYLKKLYSGVHYSIIYNSQGMKQPNYPLTDERIRKMCHRYTVEYNIGLKGDPVTCNNIDEPEGHYSN